MARGTMGPKLRPAGFAVAIPLLWLTGIDHSGNRMHSGLLGNSQSQQASDRLAQSPLLTNAGANIRCFRNVEQGQRARTETTSITWTT